MTKTINIAMSDGSSYQGNTWQYTATLTRGDSLQIIVANAGGRAKRTVRRHAYKAAVQAAGRRKILRLADVTV